MRWLVSLLVCLIACSSDAGDDPAGGDGGTGDLADAQAPGTGQEPADRTGCGSASFYEVPADTSEPGPWAVGARTVQIGRLRTEVWYPAAWNSNEGKDRIRYDIRDHLPESQMSKIPDAKNTWQDCNCYRDLPIDEAHGPYPVVLFIHGTASFRTQSLVHMTHWASRGFVVVSADHPGLRLADTLAFLCPDQSSGSQDLAGDADAMLAALGQASGDLSFLAQRLDLTRIAVVGHSAGGGAVAGLSNRDGVRVVMPWSAGQAVSDSSSLESVLYISGMSDNIARWSSVEQGYGGSPSPKRAVGIDRSGHLVVSDLCEIKNEDGKDMLAVAQEFGVCGTSIAGGLFDCEPGLYIPSEQGWEIVNYASSAVLEGVLQCSDGQAGLADLTTRFEHVAEFMEAL